MFFFTTDATETRIARHRRGLRNFALHYSTIILSLILFFILNRGEREEACNITLSLRYPNDYQFTILS